MSSFYRPGKAASKTHQMLKMASGEQAVGRTQTFEWFSKLKMGQPLLKMQIVKDVQQQPEQMRM
jgi:hypothetical protein